MDWTSIKETARRLVPAGTALVPSGRGRTAALMVGIAVAATSGGHLVVDRLTGLPEGAVLRVNDVVLSEADFQGQVDEIKALYGVEQPSEDADRDRFRRDAAQATAASLVVEQAAAEQNVVVPETEVQDALARIVEREFPGGRADFVRALGNLGVSEPDLTAELHRQLVTSRLFEQVTAGVPPVTDQDVRTAFDERRDQMQVPEQRELRNIVVDSRDKADDLRRRLDDGADFATLARADSMDESTKQAGGALGKLPATALDQPFADAAFTTPSGGLFGPVQTRFGWNLGQVAGITPAVPLTFEQVAENLRATLTDERAGDAWREWLGERIRDARIDYGDDYRPADPDSVPDVVR